VTETTDPGAASRINVNTASLDELQAISGIGEALGKAIIEHRQWEGPFQSVDDLTKIDGIGAGSLDGMRDQITVDAAQRTFSVSATVQFSTDGVGEAHVDADPNHPDGFPETYGYTLVTDAKGVVVDGTWDDDHNHPDFAWIPYHNPKDAASNNSENPYVPYGSFLSLVTDSLSRL